MSYIGTEPKDIRSFGRTKFDYTATQGQTAFTGADDDGKVLAFTVGQIEVYVNGILMDDSDFTTTGTGTVTLASAANLNDVVNVVSFETNIPDSNYVPATGGTFTGNITASGTFSSTTLKNNVTLKNDTHEDSDGGRASKIIYQGEQSGGEISTLAEIQASHDGTADDQKGDLIFKTNDGSDNNAPTTAMVIDSKQNVGISAAPSSDWGGNIALQMSHGSLSSGSSFGTGVSTNLAATNTGWSTKYLATGAASAYLQATSNGGHRFYTAPSGSAGASATITESVRIDSDGLKFNGDTAAANALDDYETGTFQMSVAGVSGGARGSGIYTKIGEVVHFQWYSGGMTVTSATPVLAGLPFTSTDPFNNGAYAGFTAYHNTYVTNANTGYINLNSTSLYFTALGSTGGPTISTGSAKYVMVTGTYYTNA